MLCVCIYKNKLQFIKILRSKNKLKYRIKLYKQHFIYIFKMLFFIGEVFKYQRIFYFLVLLRLGYSAVHIIYHTKLTDPGNFHRYPPEKKNQHSRKMLMNLVHNISIDDITKTFLHHCLFCLKQIYFVYPFGFLFFFFVSNVFAHFIQWQ